MKILFLCTAYDALAQRLALALRSHGHAVTVEYDMSAETMTEAANLSQPDLVICPFLTNLVPKDIYERWLTLILHLGAPADAAPSAFDWVLTEDDGAITLRADASDELQKVSPPCRWGVSVTQAVGALGVGPTWAFDQLPVKVDGSPDESLTRSVLYRGPVTRAAVAAVLKAVERITDAALAAGTKDGVRPDLVSPPEVRTISWTASLPLQGGPHDRPLLTHSERDLDVRTHPAEIIAHRIRCVDSQPGLLMRLFSEKAPLFVYGGLVEHNKLPAAAAERAERGGPGTVVAQRQGAVLVSTKDGNGVWITHVRRPKADTDKYLHPRLPAVMGLQADPELFESLQMGDVPEWDLVEHTGGWGRVLGTFQQVWIDVEEYPLAHLPAAAPVKMAYLHFDFYDGSMSTSQARLLSDTLRHALAIPGLKALVLMGGSYFGNGIALDVLEGAPDPATESWANVNAIDDVVQTFLDPRLTADRGILTLAAVRGNASAGGLALAAAADVVLCAEAVVLNPHYRSIGLFGSEFHTFTFPARVGEEKSEQILRQMLPMSASEAQELGLVDLVVGAGSEDAEEVDALVKAAVRAIVTAPVASQEPVTTLGAPWTKATNADGEIPIGASLNTDLLLHHKREYMRRLSQNPSVHPLLRFRQAEMDQTSLDFFHPFRSQRYHARRLAFVRKARPAATPTRFALHRRYDGPGWDDAAARGECPKALDEEERDAFDGLGDVPIGPTVVHWRHGDEGQPDVVVGETDAETPTLAADVVSAPGSLLPTPAMEKTKNWHRRSPSRDHGLPPKPVAVPEELAPSTAAIEFNRALQERGLLTPVSPAMSDLSSVGSPPPSTPQRSFGAVQGGQASPTSPSDQSQSSSGPTKATWTEGGFLTSFGRAIASGWAVASGDKRSADADSSPLASPATPWTGAITSSFAEQQVPQPPARLSAPPRLPAKKPSGQTYEQQEQPRRQEQQQRQQATPTTTAREKATEDESPPPTGSLRGLGKMLGGWRTKALDQMESLASAASAAAAATTLPRMLQQAGGRAAPRPEDGAKASVVQDASPPSSSSSPDEQVEKGTTSTKAHGKARQPLFSWSVREE